MIKTYKNINISAGQNDAIIKTSTQNINSQWDINISAWNLQNRACSCNLQNRARFSKLVEMSPNSGMLWSKLQNLQKHKYLSSPNRYQHKFSAGYQNLQNRAHFSSDTMVIKMSPNSGMSPNSHMLWHKISVGYQCFCMKPSHRACTKT